MAAGFFIHHVHVHVPQINGSLHMNIYPLGCVHHTDHTTNSVLSSLLLLFNLNLQLLYLSLFPKMK